MSKLCNTCKEEKAKTEFTKDKRAKDGLRGRCKECRKQEHKDNEIAHPGRHSQYCKNWSNKPGKKEAIANKNKNWSNNNPEKRRSNRLEKRYGITLEEYNQILKKQNECCKICKRHQTEFMINLAVDHDHKTNKVRGLLCMGCNRALGYFRDSPECCNTAADYLNDFSSDEGMDDETKQLNTT